MKKILLLFVLAISLSLSTFANSKSNIYSQSSSSDSIMLKQFEDQIRAFDASDDQIKITNIKSQISRKNDVECSITFGMEAEVSFFGTGVKFSVSCTFTAPDCAEAGRKALAGCLEQIKNFKSMMTKLEQQISDMIADIFN